jgi:hypothetical protein
MDYLRLIIIEWRFDQYGPPGILGQPTTTWVEHSTNQKTALRSASDPLVRNVTWGQVRVESDHVTVYVRNSIDVTHATYSL